MRHDAGMDAPLSRFEAILGHPVVQAVPPDDGPLWVVVSTVGPPTCVRIAWVDPETGEDHARVLCPPGVPSRWRPVIGALVTRMDSATPVDQLFVGRLAPEARAALPLLAEEATPAATPAGADGIVVIRLSPESMLLGVDAIGQGDEPVGRLDRSGIAELQTAGGRVSGRLGSGHGMAAGIGHGRWLDDLDTATFEVGYGIVLPAWVPPGFVRSRPRLEPDLSYPFGPMAVIVTWDGPDGQRVLLRQTVAPLASPDPGGALAHEVEINGVAGVVRGRRSFVTVVWQTETRAFGVQVQRMDDAEDVALEVARSIPEDD
jgi:hypothetical protein